MPETQIQPEQHLCGRCSHMKGEGVFDSREEYLTHTCKKTSFKPTNSKHLGKAFESASKSALERGASRA